MNKGLSDHDHYRKNHGFLFDLRLKSAPTMEIGLAPALLRVARARDLSLAVSQVPISPHRCLHQK